MRARINFPARRRLLHCAAAGVLLAGVAACGSDGGEATTSSGSCADLPDQPVKIGSILPLSGAFAALGAANAAGTEIAVDVFNQKNNICGHPVQLVQEDDKGDPATSITLGRKLTSDGVNVFVNAGRGQTGDALTPVLMKAGAINISDAGFNERFDAAKYPTFYGTNPNNDQYSEAMFGKIQDKQWTKIGILNDGLTGGNQYTEKVSSLLKEAGNLVVKVVTYAPTAVDLTPQLQELKSAGTETLVLAGTSGIRAIVNSLKQSGWTPHLVGWGGFFAYATKPTDLPAGTTDLCYTHLPADQAPKGTSGLDPVTVEVIRQAAAKLGDYNPGINTAHESYSRLLVAKAAIEKAGSLDVKDLKRAMDSLTGVPSAWPGISFSFTAHDHAGYPVEQLKVCDVQLSPLAIRYETAG